MGQINRVKLRGCGLRMRGLASLLRLRRLSCLPLERKHGGCLQPTKMAALANSQLLQISRRGMATGQRLVVSIDGKEEEFPWVWLRDNCQCTQCYEAISRCRIHNLTEWEIGVKPSKVEVDQGAVKVDWEGGHFSSFPLAWLKERSFREEARAVYREKVATPQDLWGCELVDRIPTADFTQVMEDDDALLDWLETLDRLGFVLVRGVPVERGPVPKLQARVAFERLTHYGPGYTVEVRPDPSNISHTAHRIFFHTDLTYYDHMPGTIFLHCIEQHEGEGGETMLVDGFHAAKSSAKITQKCTSCFPTLWPASGMLGQTSSSLTPSRSNHS